MQERDQLVNNLTGDGNRDYLISVKKAIQQSECMVEKGLKSLQSVKQIAKFLKLEEFEIS